MLTIFIFIFTPLLLGSCLVLFGDILERLKRRGNISWVQKPFIATCIINLVLWVDFNITVLRRKPKNMGQSNAHTVSRCKELRVFFGLTLTLEMACFFRHLESSVESPVELFGEDAVTFFLVAPFLWSFQEIRFAILHLLSIQESQFCIFGYFLSKCEGNLYGPVGLDSTRRLLRKTLIQLSFDRVKLQLNLRQVTQHVEQL